MTGDTEKEQEEYEGTLLFTGCTDWQVLGKVKEKPRPELPNMPSPMRFKILQKVKVKHVIGGTAAQHCLVIDSEGKMWSWGNNTKGQLGLGHTTNISEPAKVEGILSDKIVVGGALGKGHSVVRVSDGTSYSFGTNKYGQLGLGSVKYSITSKKSPEELHVVPIKNTVVNCTDITCGAEFTLWLCNAGVMSAGLPEYGQLGHGTNNQYNASESSLKLYFQPQPMPKYISALANKKILKIASGHNHSLALDSEGHLHSWGFGGYGRLGHNEQKDEYQPRQIELFENRLELPTDSMIACGGMFSFATVKGGQLYVWGKTKSTGESIMYPKPLMELSGWNVRNMACGSATTAIASETSAITWGSALYQELGYGPKGKKSSANPAKVDSLEGMLVHEVACGVGHMLFLVDGKQDVSSFEEWEAPEIAKNIAKSEGSKRKSSAKGGGRGRKKVR